MAGRVEKGVCREEEKENAMLKPHNESQQTEEVPPIVFTPTFLTSCNMLLQINIKSPFN